MPRLLGQHLQAVSPDSPLRILIEALPRPISHAIQQTFESTERFSPVGLFHFISNGQVSQSLDSITQSMQVQQSLSSANASMFQRVFRPEDLLLDHLMDSYKLALLLCLESPQALPAGCKAVLVMTGDATNLPKANSTPKTSLQDVSTADAAASQLHMMERNACMHSHLALVSPEKSSQDVLYKVNA